MGQFDRLGTSSSADFYQAMFEGADLYMSFWQPMLKGIGRAQLEMAQLTAKCGQSTLTWATSLSACRTPMDVLNANMKYLEAIAAHQRDSVEKFTAAAVKAVETPPALEVLKTPPPPSHDVLALPINVTELPRKVA